ncbi:dihydrofolate reductase family protein, partial [Francisella tularensis subsp. holarctica]|uniref:dihydrofolate reductase family protein n=1 Tax=Francisella tularensis TaxID=263 RepID=UPI002381A1D0
NDGDSKKIRSHKEFVNTHELRNICDAFLIGKQTLIDDNPSLDVRININKIKHSTRFILANQLTTINHNWRVLDQRHA